MNKLFFIICLMGLPVCVGAQEAALEEKKEIMSKLESVQKVFHTRIAILNQRLTLREQELQFAKTPYEKNIILKEIQLIKQSLERENITLEKKTIAIESGGKIPVPDPSASAQGDNRKVKTEMFFNYFKQE